MFSKIRNTLSWKYAVIMGILCVITGLSIWILAIFYNNGIIPAKYGLLPLMIFIPYIMFCALTTILWFIIIIFDFCKRKELVAAKNISKPRLAAEILFAGFYILQAAYMIIFIFMAGFVRTYGY